MENKPRTIQTRETLGIIVATQNGEVVVLADDRTAQLSLPNAERSTDSLSRCVKFDQLATLTFEQMKIKRQEEGGNMEPETGLSVSASVTSHWSG